MASVITNAILHGYTSRTILGQIARQYPKHANKINNALSLGYTAETILKHISDSKNEYNEDDYLTSHEKTMRNDKTRRKKNALGLLGALGTAGAAAAGGYAYATRNRPQVLPAPPRRPPPQARGQTINITPGRPGGGQPQLRGPQDRLGPPTQQRPGPQRPGTPPASPNAPKNQPVQRTPQQNVNIIQNMREEGLIKSALEIGSIPTAALVIKNLMPKAKFALLDKLPGGIEQVLQDYAVHLHQPPETRGQQQPQAQPQRQAQQQQRPTQTLDKPEDNLTRPFAEMGKGISENFYSQALEALKGGQTSIVGNVKDPLLMAAKPNFDNGLIKDEDDLKKFADFYYAKQDEQKNQPQIEQQPQEQAQDQIQQRPQPTQQSGVNDRVREAAFGKEKPKTMESYAQRAESFHVPNYHYAGESKKEFDNRKILYDAANKAAKAISEGKDFTDFMKTTGKFDPESKGQIYSTAADVLRFLAGIPNVYNAVLDEDEKQELSDSLIAQGSMSEGQRPTEGERNVHGAQLTPNLIWNLLQSVEPRLTTMERPKSIKGHQMSPGGKMGSAELRRFLNHNVYGILSGKTVSSELAGIIEKVSQATSMMDSMIQAARAGNLRKMDEYMEKLMDMEFFKEVMGEELDIRSPEQIENEEKLAKEDTKNAASIKASATRRSNKESSLKEDYQPPLQYSSVKKPKTGKQQKEKALQDWALEQYESGKVPKGWYVHGRRGKQDLETGFVTQFSKDWDVAEAYSQRMGNSGENSGSMWIAKENPKTKVLDLRSPYSEDMDKVVKKALSAWKKGEIGFVSGDKDEVERQIRQDFAPPNIVDNALAYDDSESSDWLMNTFKVDFVKTPDGAVAFNTDKITKIKVPNGSSSQEDEEQDPGISEFEKDRYGRYILFYNVKTNESKKEIEKNKYIFYPESGTIQFDPVKDPTKDQVKLYFNESELNKDGAIFTKTKKPSSPPALPIGHNLK